MKPIRYFFLLFTVATLGFAADKARQSQVDDIREAVFRYQFGHNGSSQQQSAKVYFLSVGEKYRDPSDAFMKRFAEHKPPVRKASASQQLRGRGIVDKRTGELGLAFGVETIKWISETEVEVRGGYAEAELSASGNTYTVKKQGGKWKVTLDKLNIIS
jgi:hypothetical protein